MPAASQPAPESRPPLSFDETTVGTPGSRRPAELFLPANADGPRPALVVLHGCSGVTSTVRNWARRAQRWGYVALMIDSFGPRGVENVCNQAGGVVPPVLRAADAFAAAAYLRTRPDVDPDRIAVIGLSHGGTTALITSTRTAVARLGSAFAGVIALYPWCPARDAPLASDVLVLIGDADDWTPAERCVAQQTRWDAALGRLDLHVYPGATHAFDASGAERIYMGHRIRPDAVATADAAERVHRFLMERFGR